MEKGSQGVRVLLLSLPSKRAEKGGVGVCVGKSVHPVHGFIPHTGAEVTHQSDTGQAKQHALTVRTDSQKKVSFSITCLWPLWSLIPPAASHCPRLVRRRKQHGGCNQWDHPLHVGTASGHGTE